VKKVKGVILAAGEGARMKMVTYGGFPKELLPIGRIPTIRFPIEAMKLAGIRDIIVVIAPQTKHGIIDGIQSGAKFGVNICYVVQEKDEKAMTGLGRAILSVKNWIGQNEDFVVACGDSILCDFSTRNPFNCIESLVNTHILRKPLSTLVVHPKSSDPTRFGVVKFHQLVNGNGFFSGEIEALIEKPSVEVAKTYRSNGYNYIIAGYYAFNSKIFSYIEKTPVGAKNEVQITDAISVGLIDGEKVWGVVHAKNSSNVLSPCEYWDVGIPEDYEEASRRLLNLSKGELASLEE
jgi:glucose-1-phosphate thymidylyltransferase